MSYRKSRAVPLKITKYYIHSTSLSVWHLSSRNRNSVVREWWLMVYTVTIDSWKCKIWQIDRIALSCFYSGYYQNSELVIKRSRCDRILSSEMSTHGGTRNYGHTQFSFSYLIDSICKWIKIAWAKKTAYKMKMSYIMKISKVEGDFRSIHAFGNWEISNRLFARVNSLFKFLGSQWPGHFYLFT